MRLLKYADNGAMELTEYLISDDQIPPYAILSHTWLDQEVTYDDIVKSSGTTKHGYEKIVFCMEQAKRDGLQYSWVDTCCTIQTYHRRQCPTKRVAYAAENSGRMHIAF